MFNLANSIFDLEMSVRSVSDKNDRNISVLVEVAKLDTLLICIPKNVKLLGDN